MATGHVYIVLPAGPAGGRSSKRAEPDHDGCESNDDG